MKGNMRTCLSQTLAALQQLLLFLISDTLNVTSKMRKLFPLQKAQANYCHSISLNFKHLSIFKTLTQLFRRVAEIIFFYVLMNNSFGKVPQRYNFNKKAVHSAGSFTNLYRNEKLC